MIDIDAADPKPSGIAPPGRVWNRIPEAIRSQIIELALDQPELSPRELAVRSPMRKNILSQRLRSIGS